MDEQEHCDHRIGSWIKFSQSSLGRATLLWAHLDRVTREISVVKRAWRLGITRRDHLTVVDNTTGQASDLDRRGLYIAMIMNMVDESYRERSGQRGISCCILSCPLAGPLYRACTDLQIVQAVKAAIIVRALLSWNGIQHCDVAVGDIARNRNDQTLERARGFLIGFEPPFRTESYVDGLENGYHILNFYAPFQFATQRRMCNDELGYTPCDDVEPFCWVLVHALLKWAQRNASQEILRAIGVCPIYYGREAAEVVGTRFSVRYWELMDKWSMHLSADSQSVLRFLKWLLLKIGLNRYMISDLMFLHLLTVWSEAPMPQT